MKSSSTDSPFPLSSVARSEFGGRPRGVAALLPAAALVGAPAQLHGAPVGGRGGHQHGAADPTQLRGEPAEAVLLVGHRLLLYHLPPLCDLLEHLRVRAAGGADPSSSLMKAPHPQTSRLSYTLTQPSPPEQSFLFYHS